MASTDNITSLTTEWKGATAKCPCSAGGIDCKELTCKRVRSTTIDPLEISPQSIAAVHRPHSEVSGPVFKSQKRQRSDATVDDSDIATVTKKDAPSRRSSSCLSLPIQPSDSEQELCRPRPLYPANFNSRIFDSQVGRTAERAASLDWTRDRSDSVYSDTSNASSMRSYSVGNLSNLDVTPSRRFNAHGHGLSSRSRSRTSSSEWINCDAMVLDLEKISLHVSPRASLSPLPAVFTPIQSHKVLLPLLQSTTEEGESDEEEEEEELVQSFQLNKELFRVSSPSAFDDEMCGAGVNGGEEDGRVTVPEVYLPPLSYVNQHISTTDNDADINSDAMMFSIEV